MTSLLGYRTKEDDRHERQERTGTVQEALPQACPILITLCCELLRISRMPPLLASAVDRMAYEGYSKILPRRTRPYRLIRIGPEYTKIGQDGFRETVSINRLTRVAREARRSQDATPDLRVNTNTTPPKRHQPKRREIPTPWKR